LGQQANEQAEVATGESNHPLMLRAIAVAKKKNDRIDAGKIADCLRCDFLPECYMAPMEIRQRRRTLRYRKLLVRQNVQLKNKIAQMLMESGVSYNKEKLHQQGYFHQVLPANPEIDPALWPLLKLTREMIERIQKTERALLRSLEADPLLSARVDRLMTIPAIGHVTALTWVLEVGEVQRFHSLKQVISYCGLCSGEKTSADNSRRMPISKQRNRHLQSVLLEAAIWLRDSTPSWPFSMSGKRRGAIAIRLRSPLPASWQPTFWPSIAENVPS
jgi:transposase